MIDANMYRIIPFAAFLLILNSCAQPCPEPATVDTPKASEAQANHPDLPADRYNVAFLIMDGVFNTEFTAPWDIFHHTIFREGVRPMNVFSVANQNTPVRTFEGLLIQPDFNYMTDSLPPIDILVVPSADGHLDKYLKDKAMLSFVKEVDEKAMFMTSHCDGAFVFAEAGLLKDRVCTTFPGDIGEMRKKYPELDIRDAPLFVHDGKYITSAGGAKSFEAALYLCEHLYGKQNADDLAEGLVIDWDLEAVPHLVVAE